MSWKKGRQNEFEYYKYKLWSFKLLSMGFDAYVLKYPNKGKLPEHRDLVNNANHWRLNINLKGESDFWLENDKLDKMNLVKKRFIFFRPDIKNHFLIVRSPTYKLSFGFVKF